MSDRGVGLSFLAIGAFLLATWYITASIFMSGVSSWSAQLFEASQEYVGGLLKYLALASAVLGCVFFIRGELGHRKVRRE